MKIQSDGTAHGTKVFLSDGTDVSKYVRSVEWKVSANPGNQVAECNMLVMAELEADGLPDAELIVKLKASEVDDE